MQQSTKEPVSCSPLQNTLKHFSAVCLVVLPASYGQCASELHDVAGVVGLLQSVGTSRHCPADTALQTHKHSSTAADLCTCLRMTPKSLLRVLLLSVPAAGGESVLLCPVCWWQSWPQTPQGCDTADSAEVHKVGKGKVTVVLPVCTRRISLQQPAVVVPLDTWKLQYQQQAPAATLCA